MCGRKKIYATEDVDSQTPEVTVKTKITYSSDAAEMDHTKMAPDTTVFTLRFEIPQNLMDSQIEKYRNIEQKLLYFGMIDENARKDTQTVQEEVVIGLYNLYLNRDPLRIPFDFNGQSCGMSKKKPLSLQEKRERILEIFHDSKEFYQLKDIEKIASTQKGVVEKSVKDVLFSLADEGLVDSDRIAQSVYYWSFPSDITIQNNEKYIKLQAELTAAQNQLTAKEEKLNQLRTETTELAETERMKAVNNLAELKRQEQELTKVLAGNQHLEMNKKKEEALKLHEAANRWTDNVLSTKSWCKNKFSMEEKTLNKLFKIPDDFDYI